MQAKYLKRKQETRWGDDSIAEYYSIDKCEIFAPGSKEVSENAEPDIFCKKVAQWKNDYCQLGLNYSRFVPDENIRAPDKIDHCKRYTQPEAPSV